MNKTFIRGRGYLVQPSGASKAFAAKYVGEALDGTPLFESLVRAGGMFERMPTVPTFDYHRVAPCFVEELQ